MQESIIPVIREGTLGYCDDPNAIISMRRSYTLDCFGNVHDVYLTEIEYCGFLDE